MDISKAKKALISTLNSLRQSLPILLGVLMLIGFINRLVPKEIYPRIFTANPIIDPLIGALIGSFSAGTPITSYVVGGELLKQGVSLLAVSAFIISWVTVGIVQLPAEALMLGRRFALVRNIVGFLTAIVISVLTVFTLELL